MELEAEVYHQSCSLFVTFCSLCFFSSFGKEEWKEKKGILRNKFYEVSYNSNQKL